MTIANQYLRPDGYVECRECRRAALRLIKKLNPLSYELIKSKEKKFWQFVQRVPGKNACWPWRGWKPKTIPYGRFCLGPRSIIAHRMALALKLGRLVNGMACHKCGNPACCRRAHLYEGDAAKNAADRDRHGRTARGKDRTRPERRARGEQSGMSKLTDRAVSTIRTLYATGDWRQVDLAERFRVTQVTISLVTRRKIWRHV